jgi:UDP-N-acetylmuramoylalanine--D-glutamate ligase
MSTYPDWSSKRVLILGFGAEGRASLRYAARCGAQEIAVADQNPILEIPEGYAHLVKRTFTGTDWLAGIADFDIINRSPGVPRSYLSDLNKSQPEILITSGTEIFLEQHRNKTIGVTGTKGKSTTSSLIHHILQSAGIDSKLGGNIGIPALNLLEELATIYVLEISSYQLEDITISPHIAVLLNLYPEHLDHHGSFELYGAAKARITRFQNSSDSLIIPSNSDVVKQLTATSQAEGLYWGTSDSASWMESGCFYYRCERNNVHKVCNISALQLKGPGNHRNILAALAAVRRWEISPETLRRAICSFRPLPHRLEDVGVSNGVTYINDSISTVPEATINALETFGASVSTIILGGFDRGVSFMGLADYLMRTRVRTIILFPPSGERISNAILEHPLFLESERTLLKVKTMDDAVRIAAHLSPPSTVCLLSPASPSFPIYKNFEERGAMFREAVLRLNE